MAFWSLLLVASMPVLQFLLIGLLGAFLASGYSNILSTNARKDVNKSIQLAFKKVPGSNPSSSALFLHASRRILISLSRRTVISSRSMATCVCACAFTYIVFAVFTPAMVFASLARMVTLEKLITWWFMPINYMIAFLIGGILALIVVKILRLEPHLENLVIAACSAGNVGNMLLIIVPAICREDGSPFGKENVCHSRALSYVSLSMALGEIYVWTHTYSLIRKSGVSYDKLRNADRSEVSNAAHPVKIQGFVNQEVVSEFSSKASDDVATRELTLPLLSRNSFCYSNANIWEKFKGNMLRFGKELLAPPIIAAILGLTTGVIPWLKSFIIGTTAPLRVIEDSAATLGHAMLPCIPLLLGANLTQGLHNSTLKPLVIIVIIFVRYIILPIIGIGVIKAAGHLGFLPEDPLYSYVLLLQFAVPPATSISTMVQLFDAGKEECSVIFLSTYLVASFALTIWSTVFMWLLF